MSVRERLESYIYYGLDGCWYWTGGLCCGYGIVSIDDKSRRAHRVSFQIYKGIDPQNKFVCHTCDHPSCINPDHLFLGTAKDNSQDMARKLRHTFGEKSHKAKLSETDVLKIKELSNQHPSRYVAKLYNLEKTAVLRILRKKTWKHL